MTGLSSLIGRRPTLPHTRARSTIGAVRLNYRVRDGNGWDPHARITQSRCWSLRRAEKRGLIQVGVLRRAELRRLIQPALTRGEYRWATLTKSHLLTG